MTREVYALLLDQRVTELNGKASERTLSTLERTELRALEAHRDKAPAVAHRIRLLAVKMAQPSRWNLLFLRFSKKFKANLAELETLVQYGHSQAVWEIAYLNRRRAVQKLAQREERELETLTLFHDSPSVLRITELKLKEDFEQISSGESRELTELKRNLYQQDGIPQHLMELFRPQPHQPFDLSIR